MPVHHGSFARLLRTAFVGVVACVLSACASTRPSADAEPLTDHDRALLVQSFDQVWNTIRDQHFDPALNGADWDAVRTEFRPKVEAAVTRDDAVAAMNGAISKLGQSHFGVIPLAAYQDMRVERASSAPSSSKGDVGLDARVAEREAVIVRVRQDSPADRAGVKAGWTILSVEGKPVRNAIEQIEAQFKDQVKMQGLASRIIEDMLDGPVGETMNLACKDHKGSTRKLSLTIEPFAGVPVEFGQLPTMYLEYDAKRLPSGVGYIRLGIFFDPARVMPWYRDRIAEYADAPGIIIDLRGNPGGIGFMAVGMGNMLVTAPDQKLGTMTMRTGEVRFVLNPQVGAYTGPVAVLVDELSMSTSEIMAGGLQAIGRARVFGVRSPGMALPSQIVRLPSGEGFQYATANYTSADGIVLEGHGVVPDQPVPYRPQSLLEGRDEALDAAESWILKDAGNAKGS